MKSLYQSGGAKGAFDAAFGLLYRFPFARWAPIPLRLIVGYGFMEHGYAKILKGPEHFVAIVHAMGVPAPEFMALGDDHR